MSQPVGSRDFKREEALGLVPEVFGFPELLERQH